MDADATRRLVEAVAALSPNSSRRDIEAAVARIFEPTRWNAPPDERLPHVTGSNLPVIEAIADLIGTSSFGTRHLLRFVVVGEGSHDYFRFTILAVLYEFAQRHGRIDLAQLVDDLEQDHLDVNAMLVRVLAPDLSVRSGEPLQRFDPQSVVRVVEQRPELVSLILETRFDDDTSRADLAYRRAQWVAFARSHVLGPRFVEALAQHAATMSRDLAPSLRQALRDHPTERIAEGLTSSVKGVRSGAAEWLGERRDRSAVPALKAALKTENDEHVTAEIIGALLRCGEQTPIDRDVLARDAKKLVGKGLPPALAFLAIDTLPRLHWRDGSEIAPEIVASWLITALKRKDPEPSPILRALVPQIDGSDAPAFARAVLERYLAWDLRTPTDLTDAETERLAQIVDMMDMSPEELLAKPDAKNYGVPTRSALAEKGVLGLVAALGDGSIVPTIDAYIRTHRGFRASQCRSLLTVLAWMSDVRATQLLLRIAGRFRTAGIQKEARKLVDELATRLGWTVADLADRTVPTAGLGDDGTMRLVYGTARAAHGDAEGDEDADASIEVTRTFTAYLDDRDALSLRDADGRDLKTLPEPRKDEDAAVAAAAKKTFSAARKELKTIVEAQRDRLYDAMLEGRRWTVSDFRRFCSSIRSSAGSFAARSSSHGTVTV